MQSMAYLGKLRKPAISAMALHHPRRTGAIQDWPDIRSRA